MKLTLNRAEFANALAIVSGVVASRTPKPILQCILLDVQGDVAVLSATDLEVAIRFNLTQIEVDKKGSVLVPGDKLGQIVRESGDETICLESADQVCHIRGQDSHFQVFSQEATEFPPIADLDEDPDFQIEVSVLRRLSEWTSFAAARENTRYAINGVLWEKSDGVLTLVATDGRRLSKAGHSISFSGEPASAIVPIKAMQVFNRVLVDPEGAIDVRLTDNQILLRSSRATVSSSLLEGRFPKYEDVIPTDCDKHVDFVTEELLSAVRRAALLTNEESKGIRFSFEPGSLKISSRAPEQGEAVITLSAGYKGPSIDIGFNPAFITDVLRVVSDETVRFEFAAANRPGLFRLSEDLLYVVMPVNLS